MMPTDSRVRPTKFSGSWPESSKVAFVEPKRLLLMIVKTLVVYHTLTL